MPKVTVYDTAGNAVGELELSDKVFGAEINEALMHQAVVMYLANRRRGTAASKTRAMVRGGGRKPWRQKGTGHARHGSFRSPLWRGGGVAFGPHPRDFSQKMPRKARRAALASALSAKVRDGELVVVQQFGIAEPKTKTMATILANLKVDGTALVVTDAPGRAVELSARNIPGVTWMPASTLNAYEVLAHRRLVVSEDAVRAIEEGFSS